MEGTVATPMGNVEDGWVLVGSASFDCSTPWCVWFRSIVVSASGSGSKSAFLADGLGNFLCATSLSIGSLFAGTFVRISVIVGLVVVGVRLSGFGDWGRIYFLGQRSIDALLCCILGGLGVVGVGLCGLGVKLVVQVGFGVVRMCVVNLGACSPVNFSCLWPDEADDRSGLSYHLGYSRMKWYVDGHSQVLELYSFRPYTTVSKDNLTKLGDEGLSSRGTKLILIFITAEVTLPSPISPRKFTSTFGAIHGTQHPNLPKE
ncbi:hypothetical protein Tco_1265721 [Tanacetum coccineum]